MDQNLRESDGQSSDLTDEDMPCEPEAGKTVQGSAMVLVLGFVALVSMACGFVLGLLF